MLFRSNYGHDGRLVTCGRDGAVIIWEPNGNKLRQLEFHSELPLRAAFTDDGKRIVTTDFNGEIGVWNVVDGKRIGALEPGKSSLALKSN